MTNRVIAYYVDDNGCFVCNSHVKGNRGYCKFKRDGKYQQIHRYIYELKHGKLGSDMSVHHTCENKMCINIEHLVAIPILEHHSLHSSRGWKLTDEDRKEIWECKSLTCRQLGLLYGVTNQQISNIRRKEIGKETG